MNFSLYIRHFFLASITTWLCASIAQANPAGARGNDFIYIMQRGDTIGLIAERFTSKPGNWRQIMAHNHITNSEGVAVGRKILVPFKLIDTYPEQGKVAALVGHAYIDQKPLNIGDLVAEQQVLTTDVASSVTLEFVNGSTISVAPESQVVIKQLRAFSGTGLIDAIFVIEKGGFTANVSAKEGVGRFEIHTPVSITGIRGTQLRNFVNADGNTVVELLHGKTDIASAISPNKRSSLGENQGISISHKAKLGKPITLLPPPEVDIKVADTTINLNIRPVDQAQEYLVRYTRDAAGLKEIARFTTAKLENEFALPASIFKFYVQTRSINHEQMGGRDITTTVLIQSPSEAESLATPGWVDY